MGTSQIGNYEWRSYQKAGVEVLFRKGLFVGEVRNGPDGWMSTSVELGRWYKQIGQSQEEAMAITLERAQAFFEDGVSSLELVS